ncbi:hypothetical protein JCM10212_002393 [Sporobolomyces blumeae]
MRSFLLYLFAAALATSVVAHGGGHQNTKMRRQHLRNKRSWGRRDGTPVVSDTEAAAPGATASAAGVIVQASGPVGCSATVGFGDSCDQASGVCCSTGLTCSGQQCVYLCGLDTTERYCDAGTPCNESLGYVCSLNRCRPPAGAVRVQNGDACDQGTGNTKFCIPGRGVCVEGTCTSCQQHS